MTRLPERLPAALSERLSKATQNIYSRQGREVDVAIGGIPFRLATYPEVPQGIETIPVRKDQFDAENDPGEQSLSGWWRRSQSSWHEGAGNLYQESNDQNISNNGFFESEGVDVFTQGRMTLLKAMRPNPAPGASLSRMRVFTVGSVRTNLCTNPGMETSLSGWVATGGVSEAPDLIQSSAKSYAGTKSLKVIWHDDVGEPGFVGISGPAVSVSTGTPVTISARVWVPSGSPRVNLVSNYAIGLASTVFDEWTTISVKCTTVSTNPLQIALWPYTTPHAGDEVYVDAVLAEAGNVLGSYFDGDSVNAVWDGTAELSSSTETIESSTLSLSAVSGGALHTAPTVDGTFAVLHDPTPLIVDGLISGNTFYDIASDGTLYQGAVSVPGSATTWPLGVTPTRIAWGKHRLWVIGGRKLWQPNLSLSGGTSQSPIFTHPNLGWKYTCMAEGPGAMYFGGHDGNVSSIQAVTLDAGGGLPTLSGAAITAVLPDGELVQEIAVVAGQFMGIGTNRGFRVGVMADSGTLTYGPLLIQPEGVVQCTAVCSQERFFVVAFRTEEGYAKAYRVDTGNSIGEGIFPYASDINCGFTGTITSVCGSGSNQLACTTNDGLAWHQSATEYVETGYLTTGRVRYRTTELKNFKYLSLEIQPLAGQIACDLIKEGGSTLPLGSITRQGDPFGDSFSINTEPMRYASVKFTMTPSEDLTEAPIIGSYLIRSLPSVTPQRMITLPLLCFDQETATSGQKYGGKDFAQDRLAAVQFLEDTADTIVYQNFSLVGGGGQVVVIESARFVQTAPGSQSRVTGPGGLLILQLRTLGT